MPKLDAVQARTQPGHTKGARDAPKELLDFRVENVLFHCALYLGTLPRGDRHFRREQNLHLVYVEQCIGHIRSLLVHRLLHGRLMLALLCFLGTG